MRDELDRQLAQLRAATVAMGGQVRDMLSTALRALAEQDLVAVGDVEAADAAVDRADEQIQHGVVAVLALHGPVGTDLRQLTATLHVSLHLERMGDYARNIAREVRRTAGQPRDEDLTAELVTMGQAAGDLGARALDAFVRSDIEAARAVGLADDAVDDANLGVFERLIELAAADERCLAWATRMVGVARGIERYADHGVDIAEQALFVSTGHAVDLAASTD